jgi:Bromodomain extra-terminal - transcription regulation
MFEKKKPVKRKNDFEESVVIPDDSAPLSLEEQELLTETINEMPQEHLGGVIQIIREAAPVGADEDEIDLEIDQLDNKTQRKLLRHIQKVRGFIISWYFVILIEYD